MNMDLRWACTTLTGALPLIFGILFASCVNYHGCQATQSETSALLAWQSEIRDPQGRLLDWQDTSLAPCNWTGILCKGYPLQVVQINLSKMSLSGALSPVLGDLQLLETLNLAGNNFSGSLPIQICSWTKLQWLILSNNSFSDRLPACIGSIPNLLYLNVEGSKLIGTIPAEIGNISSLTSLHLGGNRLTGFIPPELGRLQGLRRLHLGDNVLVGDIPSELGNLKSLDYLNFAGNDLSGSIPAQIWNASRLVEVDFSQNLLHGDIPDGMSKLRKIRVLNLSMNGLAGNLPAGLSYLPRLQALDLSYNQLTGSLPHNLGLYARLSTIDLSSNFLEGPILPSMCTSVDLSMLILSFNFFSGFIPVDLGWCESLQKLSLKQNRLSGTLLEGLGALPALKYADLSSNNFIGTLDAAQFGEVPNSLEELYLQNNGFSGSLPEGIGSVSTLSKLDLSYNGLSGDIPTQLGNCKALTELLLGHNNLSGSIPSELSENRQLQILNLSWNALSGSIPIQLGSLQSLEDLDLSNNHLEGIIPTTLGNIPSLETLALSYNNLFGPVPLSGVFRFIKNISLGGNPGLCGGQALLRLPTCAAKKHLNNTETVIGILAGLCSLVFIAAGIWWICRPAGVFKDMTDSPPGELGVVDNKREKQADEGAIVDPAPEGEELTVFHRGTVKAVEVVEAVSVQEEEAFIPTQRNLTSSTAVEAVSVEEEEAFVPTQRNSASSTAVEAGSIEDEEAFVPTQPESTSSTISLTNWHPSDWPWKLIILVPGIELTEGEVIRTCVPACLIRTGSAGSMYAGMTRNGVKYVVEKPFRPGTGENLPNVLRKLDQLRHPNLVKMLGYCLGRGNTLVAIVYEGLSGGSLEAALQSGKLSRYPHDWNIRFEIALGTVRALHYLHGRQSVHAPPLHAEVSSANILLDSRMKAHIAVMIDMSEMDSPASTSSTSHEISPDPSSTSCVDGTDIYNFGVVLLELLTGRRSMDKDNLHIVTWFNETPEMSIGTRLDPTMRDPSPNALQLMKSMFKVAARCIKPQAKDRPSFDLVQEYLLRKTKWVHQ